MKVVSIVQARRGSSRLPDKILLPLYGRELLLRMLERVQLASASGTVVVATTKNEEDNLIAWLCQREGIPCFRGSETDLLERHYLAAKDFSADLVVKIPSDCPLIDPDVIDQVIRFFLDHRNQYDYVSNLHPASFPDGNDVEIMTFAALKKAFREATRTFEREHTTPYIWENPRLFRIGNLRWRSGLDYSMTHRWTIDYWEDYDFISTIYDRLYPVNPNFGIPEILYLLKGEPDLMQMNRKYAGVNWYHHHIHELRTIHPSQTRSPC